MSASAIAVRGTAAVREAPAGARQRVYQALRRGATVNAAAAEAGVPVAIADLMIDEMRRSGLLIDATSLCASGLGACHTADGLAGASQEVRVHCAGCPLLPLAPSRRGTGAWGRLVERFH